MKNFFLTGFMGVGKTFLSSILCKHFKKYLSLDIDSLIIYIYNFKILNIFYENRFLIFRMLEKNFLNLIRFRKFLIISCGGGIILKKINVLRLNIKCLCYCIILNNIFLSKNINKKERPILNRNFFKLIKKRRNYYKNSSKFYIKNSFNRYKKFLFRILNSL